MTPTRRRHRRGPETPVVMARLLVLLCVLPAPAAAVQQQGDAARTPGDTWMRYATPEEAGWSSEAIDDVQAFADSVGTAAGMLVQDGAVVTAWGEVTHPATVASIVKALQVLVTGIFVERGDIDLDATLGELGIEDEPPLKACEKDARVRHLLSLTSGVYHRAAFSTGGLPERCSAEPGEQFVYNNWDMDALNAVLEQETGVLFQDAFWRHIARPLDFEDTGRASVRYAVSPVESSLRSPGAHLSARDMARIGLLLLRDGTWDGEQVVPSGWIERMRTPRHRFDAGHALGWLVWLPGNERLRELGTYLISGSGLNVVMMVPGRDLVFVHRAHPLHGGVHGRNVHEQLLRLLEARTAAPAEEPELVRYEPGD